MKGPHPAVVVANDVINFAKGSVTIVVAVTSTVHDRPYPHEVIVNHKGCGLDTPVTIKCNQIFTVPKDSLMNRVGRLPLSIIKQVDEALKISLGLK
ncbi:MAG: hypothetical protein A2Z27_05960 [candidate division Zixibacteria bacterium RBG_16_50_21]|nr:MAG: hypothetical protein A2Z27_05960 [candidate division Zixibacteria bacterium RBG_16_50_21]